jgi:spermidine synthase
MNKSLKIFFSLFTLGFSTCITQVLLLREFVSTFYSNEIVFGILVSVWMTLTGLGAWIGRNRKHSELAEKKLFALFILSGLLPLVLVFLLNFLKHFFFQPGILVELWQLLPLIIISLAPVCLVNGHIFTVVSNSLNYENNNTGGKLYSIESAGSIAGGLVVSFVMVFWLNMLQSLSLVFFVNTLAAIMLFPGIKKIFKYTILFAVIVAGSSVFIFNADLKVKQYLFPGQKIILTRETPYGNLTFTQTGDQFNFFENLSLLFTSENTIANEENAHFPMLQHKQPVKVLLIGGGVAGIAKEILKYTSVKELKYLEPNPWLLDYASKMAALPEDKRLNIYRRDGRNFLTNDTSKYDVIINVLPEPSTFQLNRYYSEEYVKLLKCHTLPGAVVSFNATSSENYINSEKKMSLSVLYNTIKTSFANVIVVPGEKDYFLASDSILSCRISALYRQKNINNTYVNPGFIDDRSLEERSLSIWRSILKDAPLNSDMKPVATSTETALFFSKFKISNRLVVFVVLLLMLIPVYRLNASSVYMYITGFTASSLEMLTLLVFQILFGYLYAVSGIIFSVFMAGLATGSWIGLPASTNKIKTEYLQSIIGFLAFLVPLFLTFLIKINLNFFTYPALFVLIFVPAFVTGMQFTLIVNNVKNNRTGATGYVYGVDLLGSALGFVIVSTLLLPLTDVLSAGIILAAVNFSAIAVLKLFRK